jgi:hypothetical protein
MLVKNAILGVENPSFFEEMYPNLKFCLDNPKGFTLQLLDIQTISICGLLKEPPF